VQQKSAEENILMQVEEKQDVDSENKVDMTVEMVDNPLYSVQRKLPEQNLPMEVEEKDDIDSENKVAVVVETIDNPLVKV
jgi:siderophore synthetase component